MYDIIVASATPPISGAIAIIRISGPGSIPLADKIFHPFCQKPLSTLRPRTAWYGEIRDSRGATLDRCLALTFPAPASYTGEDCAELQIHGGLTLVNRVLGAPLANPPGGPSQLCSKLRAQHLTQPDRGTLSPLGLGV